MINMFDMLMQAQNGEALKNLSRQFGIDEQQTHAAVDAVMPAFNEAMKRNAQSAGEVQQFWSDMNQRNMQQFYDSADALRRDDIWMQGNDVLGGLFGSKDVSRAVAQQASLMSGLGPQIMKQMLPVLAAMMMGGLQRQGGSANPLEAFFRQMMGQGGAGGMGGMGNAMGGGNAMPGPFGDMLEQMMGGGGKGGMGGNAQMPMGENPMGAFIEGMMKRFNENAGEAGQSGSTEHADGVDPSASSPSGGTANPFDPGDIIDALFNAGQKTQDANTEAMGKIFEQFMGSGRR
jgi:hypothetical protein